MEESKDSRGDEIKSLSQFIKDDIKKSSEKRVKKETIPFLEWLEMAKGDPTIIQLSHERIFRAISSFGYEEISKKSDSRRANLLGLNENQVMRVPNFFKNFRGIESTLVDIDNYYYIAAGQGEASRQMLFLYGPPGGGKSTMMEAVRKLLENYGFWQLEGCDHHDNPVNVIPRHLRKELSEKFALYIDPRADICPKCRRKLIEDFDNEYTKFNVEWRNISQRRGCGIAVVSEVDPVNFNMAVFIGEEDISMLGKYERGDPRTFRQTGSASRGSRVLNELVEVFKNPMEAHRFLITLTQERYVPNPKFAGQVYVDTSVVGHSNEEEWSRFKDDASNEAIMDRICVVRVPYNLRLTEEVQIYKESFLGKSKKFGNIHMDPHTIEHVAMFILSTRLCPSEKCDIMTKIKIYDGQDVGSSSTFDELIEESDQKEGMVGLSPRTALKDIIEKSLALNRHLWEGSDEKDERVSYLLSRGGYLNPLWAHASIIRYIKKLDFARNGDWPKPSKDRWLTFVHGALHKELMRLLEDDIMDSASVALGISRESEAESIFKSYIINAIAFVMASEFDINVLKSVEDTLNFSTSGIASFREETAKSAMELRVRGEVYSLGSNKILERAIMDQVRAPLLKEIKQSLEGGSERRKIIAEMERIGYAKMGIRNILNYATEHIGRD